MHHRSHDQGVSVQGGICSGGSLSKGVSFQGVSDEGGLCLGSLSRGSLSRKSLCLVGVSVQGVSVQGSLSRGLSGRLCPGGLCPGVSVWGGLCPGRSLLGRPLGQRPPHMVMSGRYASYWNAFLFGFKFWNILFSVHFILSEYVKLLLTINVFFNFGIISLIWIQKKLVCKYMQNWNPMPCSYMLLWKKGITKLTKLWNWTLSCALELN